MLTLEYSGSRLTRPHEWLIYWITERENIRKKKEAGEPKPWTEDPVFQQAYFCNVHREDDRVTRWVRRNYTMEEMGDMLELSMCAARIFNNEPTLAVIKEWLKVPNFFKIEHELATRQAAGERVWSGAYVITTHGRKMDKLDYCIEILKDANAFLPLNTDSVYCETYHEWIMRIEGFGSFLAAQVVADLKNTPGHPLKQAIDWWVFCAPGPGSLRGLSWFFGEKIPVGQFRSRIQEAWFQVMSEVPQMCMQDFQNCLCEFDKYCRVRLGTGRSKRKYPGRA